MYSSEVLETINRAEVMDSFEAKDLISRLFQQDICDILDDYEASYGDRVIY